MTYYVWLGLFAILAYLIVTDASVAKYVVLLGMEARLNYEKLKALARYAASRAMRTVSCRWD